MSSVDADFFNSIIEKRASNLYRFLSYPFDLQSIDKSIVELNIHPQSGNDKTLSSLIFSNYPELQSITVKDYCFSYVRSCEICDCNKLKTIIIGKNAFLASEWECPSAIFTIRNLPSLETLYFDNNSCRSYGHFSILGTFVDSFFSRLSLA